MRVLCSSAVRPGCVLRACVMLSLLSIQTFIKTEIQIIVPTATSTYISPEGENKYLTNTAQNYRMNLNMITNLTISECGDVVCWRGDARLVQQRREARACSLCRHEAAPINK